MASGSPAFNDVTVGDATQRVIDSAALRLLS